MGGDPSDATAYRIAIAFLGLAVVVAVGGPFWVFSERRCIPDELWLLTGVTGGLFVGMLIPFSLPDSDQPSDRWRWARLVIIVGLGAVAFCMGLLVGSDSLDLPVLGAIAGSVLLGFFIPSPSRRGL